MAPKEALRIASRFVAAAVYVLLAYALLATWWRPKPWLSQAMEAGLAMAGAFLLTRAVDGRWRAAALLGLLVEAMRLGILVGLGERPSLDAWSAAVVLGPVVAARAARKQRLRCGGASSHAR